MDAGSPTAAGEQVYRLRVVLAGISPLIWRRLDVAGSTTLAELHRILRTAFGWSGEHLHCFTVRGVDYRVYSDQGLPDGKDADSVTLAGLGLRVAERFTYDYAFFANLTSWRHDIRVAAITPPRARQRLPCCGDGSRGAPPEDRGGSEVFVALRQEHPAWQATVRSVLGEDALDVLPELLYWARIDRFDKAAVNAALATLHRKDTP